MMDNFTAIRNGILDHIRDGKICPFDFGVYVFIHLRADWSSGICHACASTIAYQFGDPKLKKHIQRSLHRLRERKYINYLEGNGKRGSCPILIHKYGVAVGGLSGTRLNAWTHGDLVRPEYEPAGGSRAVEGQWGGSRGALEGPILDLKTLQDLQDKSEGAGAPSRAKVKRAFQMPEDFAPKDSHKKLAIELGVDLDVELEVFKDHHLGHGSKFVDWDRALNKWLRNAREFRRGYIGTSPVGKSSPVKVPTGNVLDYHRELLEGGVR